REFIMKDAYSFHLDQASLQETYDVMYRAYTNIFNHLGLKFRAVIADSGSIGGAVSHEFHVLADSGEDAIAFSTGSEYAANVEKAECKPSGCISQPPKEDLVEIETPGKKSIAEVSEFLNVQPQKILKTLAVIRKIKTEDTGTEDTGKEQEIFILLFLRGDHELNITKLGKIIGEFRFATDDEIKQNMDCRTGYIGPKKDLKCPKYYDHSAIEMSDFVCGANKEGYHLNGYNWQRDFFEVPENSLPKEYFVDIRNIVEGDPSPDGQGQLTLARGIEVGHIFQLGAKYSSAMKAGIINEDGKNQIMIMGCYGIGISRVVAAAIEQNHDSRGIIWPTNLAPFQVALCPMNMHKSERLKEAAEKLYQDLQAVGIEVLLDDRKVRAGFMFSDMELIGIPHCIILSDRGLDAGTFEYKARTTKDNIEVPFANVIDFLKEKLA
ncbi:MAG: proline--tRNA ligase, partial [Methylovulum sp.]